MDMWPWLSHVTNCIPFFWPFCIMDLNRFSTLHSCWKIQFLELFPCSRIPKKNIAITSGWNYHVIIYGMHFEASDMFSMSCQCKDNFIGNPPFCKPECMRNSDCKLDKACVTNKCKDPCTNNCGLNTDCKVVNHRPICACLQGYTGDPFVSCNPLPITGNLGWLVIGLKLKQYLVVV